MRHERFVGTATFIITTAEETKRQEGTLVIIRGVQSLFNLVTIDGIGQGKVKFHTDGSFHGTWAWENEIYDVSGQADGDRTSWTGRFEIRLVLDSKTHVQGSFRAKLTTT